MTGVVFSNGDCESMEHNGTYDRISSLKSFDATLWRMRPFCPTSNDTSHKFFYVQGTPAVEQAPGALLVEWHEFSDYH